LPRQVVLVVGSVLDPVDVGHDLGVEDDEAAIERTGNVANGDHMAEALRAGPAEEGRETSGEPGMSAGVRFDTAILVTLSSRISLRR
jgi:hypothetical protein